MTPRRTYIPRTHMADTRLWACPDCGAGVLDRDCHDRWHENPLGMLPVAVVRWVAGLTGLK